MIEFHSGLFCAFLGELMENRNMLTSNAVARLIHTIVGGIAVSSQRSQMMMSLLKRSLNPDNVNIILLFQVVNFLRY